MSAAALGLPVSYCCYILLLLLLPLLLPAKQLKLTSGTDIPVAEHVANNTCTGISKIVITHSSPTVVSKYLHASFSRIRTTNEPNYTKQNIFDGMHSAA